MANSLSRIEPTYQEGLGNLGVQGRRFDRVDDGELQRQLKESIALVQVANANQAALMEEFRRRERQQHEMQQQMNVEMERARIAQQPEEAAHLMETQNVQAPCHDREEQFHQNVQTTEEEENERTLLIEAQHVHAARIVREERTQRAVAPMAVHVRNMNTAGEVLDMLAVGAETISRVIEASGSNNFWVKIAGWGINCVFRMVAAGLRTLGQVLLNWAGSGGRC